MKFVRDNIPILLFVLVHKHREFGFVQRNGPKYVDLVEISNGNAKFIHFISYNPYSHRTNDDFCTDFKNVNLLIEWFILHDRLARETFLVTREVPHTKSHAHTCEDLDEPPDPDLDKWISGRARPKARKSYIHWEAFKLKIEQLDHITYAAVRNASFLARGQLQETLIIS